MNPIYRRAWSHYLALTRPIFTSENRWRAHGLLALLVGLLLAMNGLNVINSYVGRDFMTAIAERQPNRYAVLAVVYAGVFAASTVVAVLSTYTEQRFGLWWREWMSGYFLDHYLAGRAFVRIKEHTDIDNPDQRISEDIKTFTATTLSFVIMVVNATITAAAFAGILWSITPMLFFVAVGYAALGSLATIFLGRRLVGLNNLQLKKEADFRYQLVHTREAAESIASQHAEPRERGRLLRRLQALVENFRAIVDVNRNLGFFTTGYDYLIQLIPILIVAPRYLRGEVEFGVVTQAAMAFAQILGALSLIVVQFQTISTYAAVLRRLGSLWEGIEGARQPAGQPIHVAEDADRLGYDHVTLRAPRDGRELVRDLSLDVPCGRRVLVSEGAEGGGRAVLRAAAGLWEAGEGRVVRPRPPDVVLVRDRPYLVPGTLREQLTYDRPDGAVSDDRLLAALRAVGLEALVARLGGLDVECDWSRVLTEGERELLVVARLLVTSPRFALLDHPLRSVGRDRARRVYGVLAQTSITYISLSEYPGVQACHDVVLELQADGQWQVQPARDAGGEIHSPSTEQRPSEGT